MFRGYASGEERFLGFGFNTEFTMNKLFIILAMSSAFVSIHAQVLYNNALAHGLTQEGLRTSNKPGGGSWSEVQAGNMVAGFRGSVNPGAFDRLADDFTVPVCGWHVSGASFYMYQTDATGVTINGGLFEIRANNNGKVGGLVSTGSFKSTGLTDIYRVFTNMPVDNRRIQKVTADFDVDLAGGSYFVVWATTGNVLRTGPWSPYLTKAGAQTVTGANALHSNTAGATWMTMQDGLKNQDLPFVLYGDANWNGSNNTIVPEPASFIVLGSALLAIVKRRRK